MRKFGLLAPLLLFACATAPAGQPPFHGEVSGYTCNAAGTEQFVGQEATQEVGTAIMRATHSATLRWVRPGMMVTMEFSPSRVTVRTTPDHKIGAINCG